MSNSKSKKGFAFKLILFFAIILVLLFVGILFYSRTLMNTNKIYKNIYVNGVDISNLTIEEAKTILGDKFKYGSLTLTNDSQEWSQNLSEVGFSYNVPETVMKAFEIGRSDNFFADSLTVMKLNFGAKENLVLEPKEDYTKLEDFYNDVASKVNSAPVNASVSVSAGSVSVSPSKNGYKVEMDKLKSDVKTALESSEVKSISVAIPVVSEEPRIKTEQLSSINGVIASYNTKYSTSEIERSFNVVLSAQRLDNQLLMPGDEISFQHLLGEVSTSNGFKSAKIIINNEYQDGIGGGVCQVSSTLYNALLLGGIDITQRTNHSFPIGYVPVGRDATIATPGPDLKYKNNNPFPVLIKTYAGGGIMTAQIYGDTTKSKKVDIYSEVTSTVPPNVVYKNDPNLPKGKEEIEDPGHTGYTSVTYRIVDGKKTVISRDRYVMTPKIIRTGTGPELVPTPDPNAQPPNSSQPAPATQSPEPAPSDDPFVF